MSFSEDSYENAVIELFRDQLGYAHRYGPDVDRDYAKPLYEPDLLPALRRINPSLSETALAEALLKLRNFEGGDFVQKNAVFMDYLQNGVQVNFFEQGRQQASLVYLLDFQNVERNTFHVCNQWTVIEQSEKRPDVILFVNGLPLVVFELKSPSREETDASEAYRQLRNYMRVIPSLFIYNAFCVMSDLAVSKAGTITSGEDRFMEWKTIDGSYENTQFAQFDTFVEGMFDKARFLDIIKNFICFSKEHSGDVKFLAAYHQYFAVRRAIISTQKATQTDGKGGVFWHTQGSGKSLSMVFYSRLLQKALNSPTIVVLTDRNDLDDQLYAQFAKCSDFLRQTPEQATSRQHLKKLLAGRQANGIIFTTMQKFAESFREERLSERRNIVVIADEAHRGQYGLEEKIHAETGRITIGAARIIRDSLPNATYIGFTGTPLSSKDRSTIEIFGDYIDVYDMTQAVEDGATRPVYYESRVIHLKLDEEILKLIDAEYDIMAQNAEPYAIEKSKKELGRVESILGAPDTIDALCRDILKHYEETRQFEQSGKAVIVAYSRAIAISIYRKILELRPNWTEKVSVVMTAGNDDPEDWHSIIGNKRHRDEMAKKFKTNDDPLKIVIVVDMWLTGFDVPSLATMYVFKPMSGHNLMQAIARVNRVYKDKEGGLVVDYVGIAGALKKAMSDYTNRDKKNYGDPDIGKTALPKFMEKLEVCQTLMHGYDYSIFSSGSDLQRAKAISGGANFLSTPERDKGKQTFIKEAMLLRQALSLCRSLANAEQRLEAAYFEAVRTLLTRISSPGKPLSLKEINAAINELLKQSIQSDGVINLFSDVDKGFSLFGPKFLEEISKMKERNLAVELLKKLIAEQVSIYRKTNLVKSEKFSELLNRAMKAYFNGLITNEEVIAELIKMAKEIQDAKAEGEVLGLSSEEMAFYDALTKPQAIKDYYQNKNKELVDLTKELAELLQKSRTIDWQKKQSARADMRRIVKRLLKKYKYPPDGIEGAVATVIGQCEMWADNN
jgi:type I restriction enzyme R subunit